MNASAGRLGPLAEQEFVQLLLTEIFRQGPAELGGLGQFQVFVNGALDDRAAAGDLVLFQPSADSRRISRILRMDRASSGKSDPPCFKQDQITLFYVQRLSVLFRPNRDRHSELPAISRSEPRPIF